MFIFITGYIYMVCDRQLGLLNYFQMNANASSLFAECCRINVILKIEATNNFKICMPLQYNYYPKE